MADNIIRPDWGQIKKKQSQKDNRNAYQELMNVEPHYSEELDVIPEYDVYHLQLELLNTEHFDEDTKQYAKIKKGITRDIMVSSEMSLHSLHYAIQRLFGWQNSHLHHYELDEEDFTKVTADCFGPYAELAGSIFHFPGYEMADRFWDDDYEDWENFKTWLKRKYTDVFESKSCGEAYFSARHQVEKFRKEHPGIKDGMNLRDVKHQVYWEDPYNRLLERLTVGEVFLPEHFVNENTKEWMGDLKLDKSLIDQMLDPKFLPFLYNLEDVLTDDRKTLLMLDQQMRYSPDQLKEFLDAHNTTYDKFWGELFSEIVKIESDLLPYTEESNPSPRPFFDHILYKYDYGDGWEVRISVKEAYRMDYGDDDPYNNFDFDDEYESENEFDPDNDEFDSLSGVFVDSAEEVIFDELKERVEKIYHNMDPICISSDGVNVLDDCGGTYGFEEMLRTLHGKDREEAKATRAWAKDMGWTGRVSKPENML